MSIRHSRIARCLAVLLSVALPVVAWAAAPNAPEVLPDGSMIGRPTTGDVGKTESVQSIMARQAERGFEQRAPRRSIEHETHRHPLPNLAAPEVSHWPIGGEGEPLRGGETDAPQTVSTQFLGAKLSETGTFPPDTMGAVGPTQFIVAVNGLIRSFNKSTGLADGALNVPIDFFFTSVISGAYTSDPRIRYDRLSGRWFVIIIDVPFGGGGGNRVLLAVSNGPIITASSNFTFFQFAPSAGFIDYPTLGIDANALYIGANIFASSSSGFVGTDGYVVRKSSVTGGGPIVFTTFPGLVTGGGAGPHTPQGVDNYDPAATEGYFIGVDNATLGTLVVRRVGTPGATPTLSGNISLTVPSTSNPLGVPRNGSTDNLDPVDDRLFAAHIRNGRLWTAHNIAVTTAGVAATTGADRRTGTRWYELANLATTPTLVQAGTVFDSAATNPLSYFIPSVMVSGQGHAALGFSVGGLTSRVDAATTGRLSSDTLGTTQGTPARYTASAFAYNPSGDPGPGRRWGDYSYTSLDPCDDMTMWTIQQFVNATNSYGVQAAKLLAPAPTLSCAAATTLGQGATKNVTLTGTGFYNPPAGIDACRVNIAAAVAGTGVTVNSVTFNSPTSLTLNVSATPGATAGPRSITVTNPDAQTAANTNCLTINQVGTTINALDLMGPNQVCVGNSVSWEATFAQPVSSLAPSNFELTGGIGASIATVTGSDTFWTVSANSGTAATMLVLSFDNTAGVVPVVTNFPFSGQPVTVNALPTTNNVTGGGVACAGGVGQPVNLSGSQSGVDYQLLRNGNPVGSPLAGSGSALAFGNQNVAGTYTVDATRQGTTCGAPMSGNAVVSVNPAPTSFNVTGGGAFCAGGAGQPVNLSGSQTGVNYQLLRNGNPVGSPLAGTGSGLAFGNQVTAGTYTVAASNATTTCAANMSGNAVVTVNPAPTAFSVTGGGAFCSGAAGPAVGLGGSQAGVNYQLQRNGGNVGSAVAGTGSAISFGTQVLAGNYTVVATSAATCSAGMTGSVGVTVNPTPSLNPVTPAAICTSGTTNIALASTPPGATFGWSAALTSGAVTGFANGSGTPIAQVLTGAGVVTYTVTPTLGTCSASGSTLAQSVSDPVISPAILPNGSLVAAYGATLVSPGAVGAVTFAVTAGTFPNGLTLGSSGAISGTPTAEGSFTFTVTATGVGVPGCNAQRSYTVVIGDLMLRDGFEGP